MSWRIGWTPRAVKDMESLEDLTRRRVHAALERFASTGAGDVRQLRDVHPPEWRLRVGDYRVRFQKKPEESALLVLRVRRRDQAY